MKKYSITLIVFAIMGCVNYMNKQHHLSTVNLHNYQPNGCKLNLYREDYCVYGMGALGSDLNSVYLTDSSSFRVYIGTYDNEDEHIIPKCKGDTMIVKKTANTSSMQEWNFQKVLETKTYSFKKLKQDHIAD
ncbi:hypothetical protein [Mucilaginibacter sp.]